MFMASIGKMVLGILKEGSESQVKTLLLSDSALSASSETHLLLLSSKSLTVKFVLSLDLIYRQNLLWFDFVSLQISNSKLYLNYLV